MANDLPLRAAKGAAVGIAFDDVNDWGGGFIGSVGLTNNTGGALTSWTLEFDLASSITNLWNGVIVNQVGNHYVVKNADWNGKVAPGAAVSFGFQASGGASALPTSFIWNGEVVGNSAAPPTMPPDVLPTISVTGGTVQESMATTQALNFTVSLSAASAVPVTVAYETQDGTAHAGTDYDAASGTVTFDAGQTTKTVAVATHPGALLTEAFALRLSSPANATIAQGEAMGTILNPPSAPPPPPPALPTLSALDVTVHEPPVAAATTATTPTASGIGSLLPSGYLRTVGNQIVDSGGHDVKITAVNWFGMETSNNAPHGLWTASYKTMMGQMVQQGFNAIRLPFALQTFAGNAAPNGIDFGQNPDLQGLTGLQVMDKIVDYAGQLGLKIILDDHRSATGDGPNGSGLWYDGGYTEKNWIDTWTMLARHYSDNTTVIGADLLNEPHGAATWGDDGPNDWAAAATRAGNAIQAVNTNWLILVEGVESYGGQSTWWGGNLEGVAAHPVTLSAPGHIVYSPHDYPSTVFDQPWFSDPDYPNNLPAVWDKEWGAIVKTNTAPVLVGEFGTKLTTTSDQLWLQQLVQYMANTGASGGGQGISWAYWSWNPNSGDTGGILQDDWKTVNTAKVLAIEPAEYHPATGATPPAANTPVADGTVSFTVSLSYASAQTVAVHYASVDGTAHAGVDYAAISGDLFFAAGETSKIVSTQLFATPGDSGQMQFLLALSAPQGGTLTKASATATLTHDTTPLTTPTPTLTNTTFELKTVNSWQGGYQESVVVKAGSTALQNWTVQLDTADTIGNLWNGTVLSHQGTIYTIGNAAWNGQVAAGASTSVGFVVDHSLGGEIRINP